MLGKTLRGRYKIIQLLGSGSFGDTYLAVDSDLPTSPPRVVKHFKPKDTDPAVMSVAQRLFKREAETLYYLQHEQIPKIFAYFEEQGEFYLVQDYIEGNDLAASELYKGNKLGEPEVVRLLLDILEVLAFVHQRNIIHRDIKPGNLIRRASDGKLFLIDFGAVKTINTLAANSKGQTKLTIAIGTPGYMPSEQANGHPKLCSDVYAVGIIGIQALTGIPPEQLQKDPETLEILWRNHARVSPQLAVILDKMVRYHFSQRYPSAVEALQALKSQCLTTLCSTTVLSLPVQSPLSIKKSTSPLPKKPPKGNKIASVLSLLAGAIGVGTAVIVLLFPKPAPVLPPSTNFSRYENTNYGFEIKYSDDWDYKDIYNIITKEVVEFSIAPQPNESFLAAKLVVSVEDLSSPLSLDEYTQIAKKEISQHSKNIIINTEGNSVLAEKEGYRVVYTSTAGENKLKAMEVWTLKNYKVYSLVYIAPAEQYDKYLNTAEKMIKSFKVESKE